MRLVTWNAGRGQFAKKAPWIEHLQADVAVIQEIADPRTKQAGVCWFGLNPNQGVAVLARPPYSVTPLPEKLEAPKYFVPFRVSGPIEFTLFAVWTLGDQDLRYVRAATAAVDIYDQAFRSGPVVVMGDFNSNAIWDRDHPTHLNHTALVAKLAERDIQSAYHAHRSVPHGEEKEHTFFLHRRPEKAYHIDYCFVPTPWLPRLKHVDVGSHAAWYKASDHTPLLVETEA
jgi:exodeoxyribonuclease III